MLYDDDPSEHSADPRKKDKSKPDNTDPNT